MTTPSSNSSAIVDRASQPAPEPPLYVDLDGTLIKSDLFLESLFAMLKSNPLLGLLVPYWLAFGRARLKAELAQRVPIDPGSFVYEESLLTKLAADHARGRRIVLATASDRSYGEAIARHIGLFDAVLASDGKTNLKSVRKLKAIQSDAGGGPFDYAGNEEADYAIWRSARQALVVNATPHVLRKAQSLTTAVAYGAPPRGYPMLIMRAMRLHQWIKNTLIFLPLLAAHDLGHPNLLMMSVFAFLAFGLSASSVYLLNDLSDLASDRAHPRKRNRPFASGALPLSYGLWLVPALVVLSLVISFVWLPSSFVAVLTLYFGSSMTYNFIVKDRAVWDVIVLAGLYALRVLAGAAATDIVPSFWLLAFSMFIFLSLALIKRYAEMLAMQKLGRSQALGRGYETTDMGLLQSMGIASGFVAVLVMALYIHSPDISAQYNHPKALWAICPLMLLWIARIWFKTHKGEMHDDPIVYASQDRASLLVGIGCLISIALAQPI